MAEITTNVVVSAPLAPCAAALTASSPAPQKLGKTAKKRLAEARKAAGIGKCVHIVCECGRREFWTDEKVAGFPKAGETKCLHCREAEEKAVARETARLEAASRLKTTHCLACGEPMRWTGKVTESCCSVKCYLEQAKRDEQALRELARNAKNVDWAPRKKGDKVPQLPASRPAPAPVKKAA
jgi:hypothetical protein